MVTLGLAAVAATLAATPPAVCALDPPEQGFYSKSLDLGGLAIKAHADVSDESMREAWRRLHRLLEHVPQGWSNLVAAGAELHIIGKNQKMVDMPEYRQWKGRKYEGDLTLDERARGLGGLVASCGEDNLLKLPGDAFRDHRDICSHEFAHTLMEFGLGPGLVRRLEEQYRRSTGRGLWKTAYAATSPGEYFAELSMWYFDSRGAFGRLEPPPKEGREWLASYDPEGFRLLDDLYSGRLPIAPRAGVTLALLPASREKDLRSLRSDASTGLSVRNLTAGTVTVYWLDTAGRRVKYDAIDAGAVWSISTFVTHPWVFTDAAGRALGLVVAADQPGTVVLR